jgi:hypothetical protein
LHSPPKFIFLLAILSKGGEGGDLVARYGKGNDVTYRFGVLATIDPGIPVQSQDAAGLIRRRFDEA